MTGQVEFDSYDASGVVVAVELVNELTVDHAFGRPVPRTDPFPALRRLLMEIDPPSAEHFRRRDVPGFMTLATRMSQVLADLRHGDVDAAAGRLNELLAEHPARPHLAKDHGRWRLHHHPVDAAVVPMWTAICAEGMARMIAAGAADRLGTCASADCDRVFLDGSKNGSRRFCAISCQNRVKAATFRRRRSTSDA